MTVDWQRLIEGDRATLARAITLVESLRSDHQAEARALIERILPHTGNSVRVAITGVPGAGKSTFIESLGTHITQDLKETVAVLAIDPSSPVSGGSILGDKTRMPRLSIDRKAFIRPTPSSGGLGGVHQHTRETILLCEAAGFRNVLVETVGVGQSEVTVSSMTDFFLLLLLPNAGDELQGIKRGIVEMADLIAVNKADANPAEADLTRRHFENALLYLPPSATGWRVKVVTCSALSGLNVASIWEQVLDYTAFAHRTGLFEAKRRSQLAVWLSDAVRQGVEEWLSNSPEALAMKQELEANRLSPMEAATRMVASLTRALKSPGRQGAVD
jgi:LAO/AO transport system kinase